MKPKTQEPLDLGRALEIALGCIQRHIEQTAINLKHDHPQFRDALKAKLKRLEGAKKVLFTLAKLL